MRLCGKKCVSLQIEILLVHDESQFEHIRGIENSLLRA